jgi:hypothetical protein
VPSAIVGASAQRRKRLTAATFHFVVYPAHYWPSTRVPVRA